MAVTMSGAAAAALDLTSTYVKERKQFGRAIATFQAVSQRAADTYINKEAIKLTSWQAAWRLDTGKPATTQVATAKYWAAQGGQDVLLAAHHLHGGVGVDRDYPLYRYFLLAKQMELDLGSETPTLMRPGRGARRDPGRLTRSCASAGSSSPVGSSPSRSVLLVVALAATGAWLWFRYTPASNWISETHRIAAWALLGLAAVAVLVAIVDRVHGVAARCRRIPRAVRRCRRCGTHGIARLLGPARVVGVDERAGDSRGGRRRPRRPGEVRHRRWSAALAVDVREVVVRPSRARRARARRARAPVAAHAFVDPPGGVRRPRSARDGYGRLRQDADQERGLEHDRRRRRRGCAGTGGRRRRHPRGAGARGRAAGRPARPPRRSARRRRWR